MKRFVKQMTAPMLSSRCHCLEGCWVFTPDSDEKVGFHPRFRRRSNPSGKSSQERLTQGTVTSTMRRAAHPSGCARCGAGISVLHPHFRRHIRFAPPIQKEYEVEHGSGLGAFEKWGGKPHYLPCRYSYPNHTPTIPYPTLPRIHK